MLDVGSLVHGKYRLVRLLGDGGMGSVYEALHASLGTRVALKLLHPELARRTGLVERFLQEARVAAQIRSAHVVQVMDVDRTPDGHAFIVMELLEGEPLSAVLERQRKLPVPVACEYARQILEALEAAHALGVIHRDLKPENVFVTRDATRSGRPVLKLIDFGIAKARRTDPQQRNLTVAGVVMGTAEYMAPEQARSADKVDARADLYAVGVMLYEMIAGRRPIDGDDARVIAFRVERGEIVPLVQAAPEVPRELAGLVHHAMAPRPEMRFATATEMRLALEHAMAGPRGTAAPASAPPAPTPVPEMTATGTLKNVPAQQVLAAAAASRPATVPTPARTPVSAEPSASAPQTLRAAPLATAMAAPVYAAGMAAPMAPAAGDRGVAREGPRGNGRIVVALVLLSLLLGAGVVAMLVQNGTLSFASQGASPATASASATATATATPTATGWAAIPSLSLPTPGPAPSPAPRPAPSGHPPPPRVEDAAAPPSPFPFPTVLPSVLPFPTALPSTFPTAFPSVLPPWPFPTSPAPPAPAESGPTI